jgi:hypothetical protein
MLVLLFVICAFARLAGRLPELSAQSQLFGLLRATR